MSSPLPPDSHRRLHSKKLGAHLTRTLVERRISKRGLAETLSTSRSLLILWCKGDVLPSLDQARELSEALDDPKILKIVADGRMLTCPVCERRFEWRGGGRATYCSDRCRKYGRNGVARRRSNISLVENELALFKDRVAAFCGACELDGICKTAECELRPVSPLPLRAAVDVDAAQPWQQGPLTDEGRAALSEKSRARWADPEFRERNLAAIAAAGHPAHDERRDAWRRRISAGQRRRAEVAS